MPIFNQNNTKPLHIEMYKGKNVGSFSTLKVSHEQPPFHIGMGSTPLARHAISRGTQGYML
jgi:hypothetical protein